MDEEMDALDLTAPVSLAGSANLKSMSALGSLPIPPASSAVWRSLVSQLILVQVSKFDSHAELVEHWNGLQNELWGQLKSKFIPLL